MENPFLFGKALKEGGFTNRTADIKRLKNNFQNNINSIIISPRRWGKTSLVRKTASLISGKAVKVVFLDLFSIRNEEEFYKILARETIKCSSNKFSEWLEAGKAFFKNITPKFSIGNDPMHDFDVSFEWKSAEKNYKELLNLPEKIAVQKKLKLIICIDEFQNLESFKEPLLFQQRLRAEWQHHQHVCYCLYGSRHHMMTTLFEKQSMPFYKFGDVMYLEKIHRADWIKFIVSQFSKTGKKINERQANTIAETVKDHSYYVQQLSYMVWNITTKAVTTAILQEAIDMLIYQNSNLYIRDTDELSNVQLNFLKAVTDGITSGLSSREVMHRYKLGTSANVLKIKKALIDKELIDEKNSEVSFLDPVYELWFYKHIIKQEAN